MMMQPGLSARAHPRARVNLRWRLGGICLCLGAGALLLVVRAGYVQLVDHAFYQQHAEAQILRDVVIPTRRGTITDRNGEPLAISIPAQTLTVHPDTLLAHPESLPLLADAIGMEVDALTAYVQARRERKLIYLPGQRRLNPAAAQRILALGIPGVFSQREYRRFYPQGELMAHVLGLTDVNDRGQEGIELAFDAILGGTPGQQRIIRDRQGRRVEQVEVLRAPEPGQDIALSLDQRIQYLAWRELSRALAQTNARSASAVVLNVMTGEVLAMVNLPSYNNNNLAGTRPEVRRNRAVTDPVQPGSTIKPLTVAAALEAGVVRPDTRIDTNPGWIPNGPYRTTDMRNYGVLDVTGVITKSSNVGVAKIVQKLPGVVFYRFLSRFGYGGETGSGFPGEAAGVLPEPAHWDGTTRQSLSYGYALSATPLQIAQVYAALGNGGRLVRPSFIKDGQDPGDEDVVRQVLEPQVVRQVLAMMQTTTEAGGTATRAAIAGYHVAGKTGTALRASGGGYEDRYTAFFAGIVPVEQPRFAMVVVMDDPDPSARQYTGGFVSAPVFQQVMQETLRLMDVPPDNLDQLRSASLNLDGSGLDVAASAQASSRALPLGGLP